MFSCAREWLKRFVSLGEHEATAIALWVMMTHTLEAFDCAAYLSITSAEKQCGKTRLLEVLEQLVGRPWLTGRTTPAVLARKIHAEHPTLLLDESDATFNGDREFAETLRGILNTGYLRSGKTSLCTMRGKMIEYVDLSTFGAKAIAGIGSLPDTVADRSVPIRLTRKLASESVERFRRRRIELEGNAIRARLAAWAQEFLECSHPEPTGLDALPDRAADICEPLLMIAETCDEDIAARARQAVVTLCGHVPEDESRGVRLLRDIRAVFDDEGADRIASARLAEVLTSFEESPWGPQYGKPFDARALARLLKPFNIRPRSIRIDDVSTPKGYNSDQFTDVWARYLPSGEKLQQPQRPPQPNKIRDFLATAPATQPTQVPEPPLEKPDRTNAVADVAVVAVLGDRGRVATPPDRGVGRDRAVTAVEVLRRATKTSLPVFVRRTDRIVARGGADAIEVLKPDLTAHRPEFVAVRREHGGTTATDAVLTAQRLLREGRWPETVPENCGFFIGRPDVDQVCRRCGSSWHEHTIRATDGER
jgi:hypothetical protein